MFTPLAVAGYTTEQFQMGVQHREVQMCLVAIDGFDMSCALTVVYCGAHGPSELVSAPTSSLFRVEGLGLRLNPEPSLSYSGTPHQEVHETVCYSILLSNRPFDIAHFDVIRFRALLLALNCTWCGELRVTLP